MRTNERKKTASTLNYPRHFLLLAGIAAFVGTNRWTAALGAVGSFGVYGALHSATLVCASRTSLPPGRKVQFIASGAILSMFSVALGLCSSRFGLLPPGTGKTAWIVGLCAGTGAMGYSILVRCYLVPGLTLRGLASITLACIGAALAVLASGIYIRGGPLWFVALWWCAFSAALCYYDGGPAASGLAGELPARRIGNPLR